LYLVILNNLWKFEEILYVKNWEKSEKLVFLSKLPMFLPPPLLGQFKKTVESDTRIKDRNYGKSVLIFYT